MTRASPAANTCLSPSPSPSPSPNGKRSREADDEFSLDNFHSHKRDLSEIMATSLNGLTVGDSLAENIMDSPARDDLTLYCSPMSEDFELILDTVILLFTPPFSNLRPQAARPVPSLPTGTRCHRLPLPTSMLYRAALCILLLPLPTLVSAVRTPMASGFHRRPMTSATQLISVELHSSGRCKRGPNRIALQPMSLGGLYRRRPSSGGGSV